MQNNEVFKVLSSHKSIRKFLEKEVEKDKKEMLENAFLLAPTAQGLQSCSLIEITDKNIKSEIAKFAMQDYVKDVPLMYVIVVDMYKNAMVNNKNLESLGINHLIQGHVDGMIAAQSMYVLAESLGLNGFYMASFLKEAKKFIKLLNLPKFTYPVVALCLGYANEKPSLKPRLDKKYRIFENTYTRFEDYTKEFEYYDELLNTYVDLRNPDKTVGKFTDILKTKFNTKKVDISLFKEMGFEI